MEHRDSLSGGKRLPTMPQTQEVIETPDLLLQNPDLLAALELFLPDSELMWIIFCIVSVVTGVVVETERKIKHRVVAM